MTLATSRFANTLMRRIAVAAAFLAAFLALLPGLAGASSTTTSKKWPATAIPSQSTATRTTALDSARRGAFRGYDPAREASGLRTRVSGAILAAKPGVLVEGAGTGTRTLRFRPNAADLKWGLTKAHLNKHLFGTGPNSLRTIDPAGNPDLWRNYIQDLAGRAVTRQLNGGMQDIIGTFPKSGGSGSFKFGIRISPRSDGTHDLVTLLTRQ